MTISYITLFFRFFNLSIFAAFGAWVFKKYFKSSLDEKISQKETLVKGLEEQELFLKSKAHNIEKKLLKQDEMVALLKEKIMEWTIKVDRERERKIEEIELYSRRAIERVNRQSAEISRLQSEQKQVEAALGDIMHYFDQHKKDNAWPNEYLAAVIDGLKRG